MIEFEIGLHLRLVDIIVGFANFLCVKLPVRGAQCEATLLSVDYLLHAGCFAARLGRRRGNHIGHQLLSRSGRLGHFVIKDEIRVG